MSKTNLRDVPLSQISVKAQPRSQFEQLAIRELADGIRAIGGLIHPITINIEKQQPSKPTEYSVVCGERRYHAYHLLQELYPEEEKWNAIPSLVYRFTEQEILDRQVMENIQREDMNPMDEAVTFLRMNEQQKQTPVDIAARLGKSVSYVTSRLKLNNLVEQAKTWLYTGVLPLPHALKLATLTETDQQVMLKACISTGSDTQGKPAHYCCSLKDFTRELTSKVTRELARVPFALDDAQLLPEAGACRLCPKRTGYYNSIFAETFADDRCLDRKCFEKKHKQLFDNLAKEVRSNHNQEPVFHASTWSIQGPKDMLSSYTKVRYFDSPETETPCTKAKTIIYLEEGSYRYRIGCTEPRCSCRATAAPDHSAPAGKSLKGLLALSPEDLDVKRKEAAAAELGGATKEAIAEEVFKADYTGLAHVEINMLLFELFSNYDPTIVSQVCRRHGLSIEIDGEDKWPGEYHCGYQEMMQALYDSNHNKSVRLHVVRDLLVLHYAKSPMALEGEDTINDQYVRDFDMNINAINARAQEIANSKALVRFPLPVESGTEMLT